METRHRLSKDVHDGSKERQSASCDLHMKPDGSHPALVDDAVCGMKVNPLQAKGGHSIYNNQAFFFCSPRCKEKFDNEPDAYISPQKAPPITHASANQTYTCPMHPEIEQVGPGSCPICGMALEPKELTAEEVTNPELTDFLQRLRISTVFTVPLVSVSMLEMVIRAPTIGIPPLGQFLLATPVVLWAGKPFFERAWLSFKTKQLNMFSLIAIGTGVAYFYSIIATFFASHFPDSVKGHAGQVGLYYEAAAVIITLVLLGQVLELKARQKTSKAIRALLGLSAKTARRLGPGGSEEEVLLEEIRVGDRLLLRPGEKIPADGVVVEGAGTVNESMITGEALPVQKFTDSKVTGATINLSGSFVMKATRVGSDTTLAQIVKLVSEAQRSRAPIQGMVDKVAAKFVPMVLITAVLTAACWLVFGNDSPLTFALLNSVAVLIIACPCALGLATPMSIMVGTGRGARSGVLLKNAEAIENMGKVATLVVDKTGTLTLGKPKVSIIKVLSGFDETKILVATAALEKLSEHPIGYAIVEYAKEKNLNLPSVVDFQSITGRGVKGSVDGQMILLGSRKMLASEGIDVLPLVTLADSLQEKGNSVIYIAVDKQLAGAVAVRDPVKETAKESIAYFKSQGIEVVMLTGDNQLTASAVAKELGIEKFRAEVLPQDKHEIIRDLQKQGKIIAMVGDGINDAPALAQADVGIAMGTGTDVAIESADVTLLGGDIKGAVRAHKLSSATMRNIKQNLFFAFAYNVVGIPIAAGVLFPVWGITLDPMLASLAMSLSSFSVIINALRLNRAHI